MSYRAWIRLVFLAGLICGYALPGCSGSLPSGAWTDGYRSYAAPRAVPVEGQELRVMSANVRRDQWADVRHDWRNRRRMLVELIRRFDPDVLGTQEALRGQAAYLHRELSDYDFVGVGRGDGEKRGEMCAIFFRRSRFEKLDAGHFWMSRHPDRPGTSSWGALAPRMASWVKLRHRSDGQVVYVFNTH
jgi:endonuclease/exonuclease/phosphatase family metal-dependent hydrolase